MLAHVLRLTEGVTNHRVALRIDPAVVERVGDALELFLSEPAGVIEAGLLPSPALDHFLEMGECLFNVVADGDLGPLHQGLRLFQGPEPVSVDSPLLFERRPLACGSSIQPTEVMLADLVVDRRGCTYDRDWDRHHRRKIRQAEAEIDAFLLEAAAALEGSERAARALADRTEDDKELLLLAAARRIFAAPFELYSRFVGRRRLIKDGIVTLRYVTAGDGGACSEKAQALRLVADALELPATYVIAGPAAKGEVPVDALLEILETFDGEYSRAVQTYWNHIALLVEVNGREVLVDASNGNIPFLWVTGAELTAMLDLRGDGRRAVRHRYVTGAEDIYYNRVDQVVPERLLYALELGWADPHIDLVQALDDELGLLTMPDLWLGLLPFRDEAERQVVRDWYLERWLAPGLIRGVLFTEDPAGDTGPLARELAERYPRAARAATEGRRYIETRLEEANPGAGYRIEFVVVGRKE